MRLNRAQKEFLLDNWFEPRDLLKIFETIDTGAIADSDIELKPDSSGWPRVIVDGEEATSINAAGYRSKYAELIGLGGEQAV